jgi:hypothetical protein
MYYYCTVCPHTYMCVLIPTCVSSYYNLVVSSTRSSHTCVLILLYVCPHTTIYVASYSYICVLILLYKCLHTPIYVSAYYFTCGLILQHVSSYSCLCQRGPLSRGLRARVAGVVVALQSQLQLELQSATRVAVVALHMISATRV